MGHIWRRNTELFTYGGNDTAVDFSKTLHNGPCVVFAGTASGQTSGAQYVAPGAWHTVDLKPYGVAPDAKSCRLVASLICTEATLNQYDEIRAAFRPPGSTMSEQNYQMHSVAFLNGDGAREGRTVRVPLEDGCFELFWEKYVGGVPYYGAASAFLVNMTLEEWSR